MREYYRQIEAWLPCSGRARRRILNAIRGRVEEYRAEHPGADDAMIQAHFGEPKLIAQGYLDEMGTEELLTALRFRRKIVPLVAGAAVSMMLLWTVGVGIALADVKDSATDTTKIVEVVTTTYNTEGDILDMIAHTYTVKENVG